MGLLALKGSLKFKRDLGTRASWGDLREGLASSREEVG
jgi:hypothetical protein